jgi:hypothetical protein
VSAPDHELTELRQRWPGWEIDHRWFGWCAWPRGTPVLFAVFPDSLERQIREQTEGPAN